MKLKNLWWRWRHRNGFAKGDVLRMADGTTRTVAKQSKPTKLKVKFERE